MLHKSILVFTYLVLIIHIIDGVQERHRVKRDDSVSANATEPREENSSQNGKPSISEAEVFSPASNESTSSSEPSLSSGETMKQDGESSPENSSSDSENTKYSVFKTNSQRPKLKSCKINLDLYQEINKIISVSYVKRDKGLEDYEKNLDKYMLNKFVRDRGLAQRAIYAAKSKNSFVPAGLNLGGESVVTLDTSALFFHRVKLRNSTHFTIKNLHNDLTNRVLLANISMHDLHLLGEYERFLVNASNNNMFYTPTFGEAEMLLSGVEYSMDGRYRLAPKSKIFLELIVSNMTVNKGSLVLKNPDGKDSPTAVLEPYNLDNFMERMKGDMDEWIKDYMNDLPSSYKISDKDVKVDQEKTLLLNNLTERVIKDINDQTRKSFPLPPYKIVTVNGVVMKLREGQIIGLDTLYRRSAATIRNKTIDVKVGFTNAKIIYKYLIKTPAKNDKRKAKIFLSANDVSAHMTITPEVISFSDVRFLRNPTVSLQGKGSKESRSILTITLRDFIERKIGCLTGQTFTCQEDNKKKSTAAPSPLPLSVEDPAILVLREIVGGIKDFQKLQPLGKSNDDDDDDDDVNYEYSDDGKADDDDDVDDDYEEDDDTVIKSAANSTDIVVGKGKGNVSTLFEEDTTGSLEELTS